MARIAIGLMAWLKLDEFFCEVLLSNERKHNVLFFPQMSAWGKYKRRAYLNGTFK